MSIAQLPTIFIERLKNILPAEHQAEVAMGFTRPNPTTIRINTLKVSAEEVKAVLDQQGIKFVTIPWSPAALLLPAFDRGSVGDWDLVKEGKVYPQALSSMLPVLVLNPHPGERILDLCAAPGSKTTQIAACMNNDGQLIAVETVKGRFFKLKSVIELLGVLNVSLKLTDGRYFRNQELFDRILLDAPCSSEGRFKTDEPKSFAYWSPRKIKEMQHKQKGLLLNAVRLLKPGGTLVYSTCTFAPEENEEVIDWCLRKTDGMMSVAPSVFGDIASYPPLEAWGKKEYAMDTRHCWRVLPTDQMEGFFITKLIKKE